MQNSFKFSHNKPTDTDFMGFENADRNFLLYRDLGVVDATNGKIRAVITKANLSPQPVNDWHYHKVGFNIIYMLKGWAKFMYNDKVTVIEAGDCIVQPSGIVHLLFDYSLDMEYLEIVSPIDPGHYNVKDPYTAPLPTGIL